ncbi:MAG TPA: efflux RND transporter periplasmic adaptor subunit, partial [Rhodanobacteraceae bacterium]|nr:efflux RND transporter periplasmic adaptor subunit [Rhodanobacteraceae bacterium]
RSKATVKVRVALDQKDARIVPDLGVRVSFLEEAPRAGEQPPPPKGVLIPSGSIVQRGDANAVFAIDGDKVRQRTVTPGQTMGELRLVEGIAAGTRVVRAPPAEMKDGSRVTIKK